MLIYVYIYISTHKASKAQQARHQASNSTAQLSTAQHSTSQQAKHSKQSGKQASGPAAEPRSKQVMAWHGSGFNVRGQANK